jgi:hypothetical protein
MHLLRRIRDHDFHPLQSQPYRSTVNPYANLNRQLELATATLNLKR